MPGAWDITSGGASDLIIAIVDTGVTAVPPQNLNARTWNGSAIVTTTAPVAPSPDFNTSRFVSPRDFTTASPSGFVVDTDGHGTHVAGTIGEESNNSLGLAGIAYNARLMPVKVCESFWDVQFAMSAAGTPGFAPLTAGGCSTSDIIAGIRYAADNGAKVINVSIGGPQASQSERDAITYAVSRGAFVSISNGNDFLEGNGVSYPAGFAPSIDGAMSVAATTMTRLHAAYSSTGPHTEIAAPGGDTSGRRTDRPGLAGFDSAERQRHPADLPALRPVFGSAPARARRWRRRTSPGWPPCSGAAASAPRPRSKRSSDRRPPILARPARTTRSATA